jgi:hypothetical protein
MFGKYIYRLIAIIVLVFSCQWIMAQKTDTSCVALVRDYVKRMQGYGRPQGKKVYFMDMQVKTVYRPDYAKSDSDVRSRVYLSADKMQYESAYVSMYQDQYDAITIVHPQKLIVWNPGEISQESKEMYATLSAISDTLFARSKVLVCRDIKEGDRHLRELVLQPDAGYTHSRKVRQVVYHYDIGERRVYKSIVYYTEDAVRRQETTTYHRLSFNHSAMPFSRAERVIRQANGKLVERYKNYELIDNRKLSRE